MITLLFCSLFSAHADNGAIKVEESINQWVAFDQVSPFAVDKDGTQAGHDLHLDARSIIGLSASSGRIQLTGRIGGRSAQIWGEAPRLNRANDQRYTQTMGQSLISPRELSVGVKLDQGLLKMGLMSSHWGMGMLANSGEADPEFGFAEFGDRVVRARFTTKPSAGSPWHLTAAVDRVVEDELVDDPSKQWATQRIASLFWKEGHHRLGIYGALRHQDFIDEGRSSRASVVDLYGSTRRAVFGRSAEFEASFEAAMIKGKTNRATSSQSKERLLIDAYGATSDVRLMVAEGKLEVGARSGFASGDNDPSDGAANDFSFDRNFGVGMVVFDHVMGAVDARSVTLLSDPSSVGSPPDGVDVLVHEGSFRRAAFVQPIVAVSPTPWSEVKGGLVMAWSTAPVAHPFYTARNGGTPVNHLGRKTSGYGLAKEINWALTLSPFHSHSRFSSTRISVQGGHAYLDENISVPSSPRVDRLLALIQIQ